MSVSNLKQTPVHESHNPELLALMPPQAKHVLEVGCSSGALAREYKKVNPGCWYSGIDIDQDYVDLATRYCDTAICADVEAEGFDLRTTGDGVDCWVFGDTLEHLRNPWGVLKEVREFIPLDGSIVACIPNAQHWSVQAKLSRGDFIYEDSGLFDRTHLRWFTRKTIFDLFESSGYELVDGVPRIIGADQPGVDRVLNAVGELAACSGEDPEIAIEDALPLQYVVRAVPV